MRLDLPRAHATGVHRDDLAIEAGEAALVFGDQLRVEAALPVARYLQCDPSTLGQHRLAAIAVAAVAAENFINPSVVIQVSRATPNETNKPAQICMFKIGPASA